MPNSEFVKPLLETSRDAVDLQVVSGQLEGTMFDMKAARKLEEEEEDQRQGKPAQRDTKQDAREAAVAARSRPLRDGQRDRLVDSPRSATTSRSHQTRLTSRRC